MAALSERPPGAVVPAQGVAVVPLLVRLLVELWRGLDLALRPVHVDLLVADVDPADHTGRQHDLLAENPWPGVHDDVSGSDLVRGVVDLADVAVGGLHLVAGDVHRRPVARPVGPDVGVSHRDLLSTLTAGHCGDPRCQQGKTRTRALPVLCRKWPVMPVMPVIRETSGARLVLRPSTEGDGSSLDAAPSQREGCTDWRSRCRACRGCGSQESVYWTIPRHISSEVPSPQVTYLGCSSASSGIIDRRAASWVQVTRRVSPARTRTGRSRGVAAWSSKSHTSRSSSRCSPDVPGSRSTEIDRPSRCMCP